MSIIGTRPPLISETNLYELHHRARLAIKPGITGMWQVSGRSDITDFEEVVRLDKEYITNKLATLSGITQSTLNSMMRGETKNPKLKTLRKIAMGFNMTVSELLDFPEMNEMEFEDE